MEGLCVDSSSILCGKESEKSPTRGYLSRVEGNAETNHVHTTEARQQKGGSVLRAGQDRRRPV